MNLTEQENMRAIKDLHDTILKCISITLSHWGLMDVKVIVTPYVMGKLEIAIGCPGINLQFIDGILHIGQIETMVVADEKQHFVTGELPFKIMRA